MDIRYAFGLTNPNEPAGGNITRQAGLSTIKVLGYAPNDSDCCRCHREAFYLVGHADGQGDPDATWFLCALCVRKERNL